MQREEYVSNGKKVAAMTKGLTRPSVELKAKHVRVVESSDKEEG